MMDLKKMIQAMAETNKSNKDVDTNIPLLLPKHFGIMHPDIYYKKQRKRSKLIWTKDDTKETDHKLNYITPAYIPGQLSDKSIPEKTGFVDEEAMLAFIIVVCNGDIE